MERSTWRALELVGKFICNALEKGEGHVKNTCEASVSIESYSRRNTVSRVREESQRPGVRKSNDESPIANAFSF